MDDKNAPKRRKRLGEDHVLWNFRESRFECRHCGDLWPFHLPCLASVFVAASKAYGAFHKYCRPKEMTLERAPDDR